MAHVQQLEADLAAVRAQLEEKRQAEAVYHDIIAEMNAVVLPEFDAPLQARVDAVLVGCDNGPTLCKEFQDAVEGKLQAEAALTALRAERDAKLHVWTLAEMFRPSAPFEYDQGDILLTYWDDLYDLNRRAEKAEAELAEARARLAPKETPMSRVVQLLDRLEGYYVFECEGGPLKNCVEWQELRARLAVPPQDQEPTRYAPCIVRYFDGREPSPSMVPVPNGEFYARAEVEGRLAVPAWQAETRDAIWAMLSAMQMPAECPHDAETDYCDSCAFNREKAIGAAASVLRKVYESLPPIPSAAQEQV